jgi:hypothetical protein
MKACGYACVRVQGMVKARKYGILSASVMCTPAMAEGLSMRTSASLHASHESYSTGVSVGDDAVTHSRPATDGTS